MKIKLIFFLLFTFVLFNNYNIQAKVKNQKVIIDTEFDKFINEFENNLKSKSINWFTQNTYSEFHTLDGNWLESKRNSKFNLHDYLKNIKRVELKKYKKIQLSLEEKITDKVFNCFSSDYEDKTFRDLFVNLPKEIKIYSLIYEKDNKQQHSEDGFIFGKINNKYYLIGSWNCFYYFES